MRYALDYKKAVVLLAIHRMRHAVCKSFSQNVFKLKQRLVQQKITSSQLSVQHDFQIFEKEFSDTQIWLILLCNLIFAEPNVRINEFCFCCNETSSSILLV